MFLPMENQESGERLRSDFHSPAQGALRSAVRHENNVFRFEHRVGSFSRQDFPQINRSLLSFTTLLIRSDDPRLGLRSGSSKALAQGQRLQNGNLFVRFQREPAGPPNLANYVYDPGASNLDNVTGMNQGIAASISRLEKVFQVHLHGTFPCRSIAVEGRGDCIRLASVLRAGRRRIRYSSTICGQVRLRGQSRASQNEDGTT